MFQKHSVIGIVYLLGGFMWDCLQFAYAKTQRHNEAEAFYSGWCAGLYIIITVVTRDGDVCSLASMLHVLTNNMKTWLRSIYNTLKSE